VKSIPAGHSATIQMYEQELRRLLLTACPVLCHSRRCQSVRLSCWCLCNSGRVGTHKRGQSLQQASHVIGSQLILLLEANRSQYHPMASHEAVYPSTTVTGPDLSGEPIMLKKGASSTVHHQVAAGCSATCNFHHRREEKGNHERGDECHARLSPFLSNAHVLRWCAREVVRARHSSLK
jgi:hypothetical protein